jgi:hypothetical protein
MDEFIRVISDTRHRSHVSVYSNIKMDSSSTRKSVDWQDMIKISKNTLIPIDEILDRLTLEEYWLYYDAMIYWSLEETEKWRAINNKAYNKVKDQKTLQKQKESLEMLRAYKKKKKWKKKKIVVSPVRRLWD